MNIREVVNIGKQAFGRGIFPHQMSWFLDLPGRSLLMSARKVASRLPLIETANVLEIGPGSGYYSVEVARKIPAGHLELYDIQQEMLEICKSKMTDKGIINVGYTKGDGALMPFEPQSFDIIYMITVFGEIEKQISFLDQVKRFLKKDGTFSITEHHPDPDFVLFPKLNLIIEENGFRLYQKFGWRWAYTANYKIK